jgi:hypothetical protein
MRELPRIHSYALLSRAVYVLCVRIRQSTSPHKLGTSPAHELASGTHIARPGGYSCFGDRWPFLAVAWSRATRALR